MNGYQERCKLMGQVARRLKSLIQHPIPKPHSTAETPSFTRVIRQMPRI